MNVIARRASLLLVASLGFDCGPPDPRQVRELPFDRIGDDPGGDGYQSRGGILFVSESVKLLDSNLQVRDLRFSVLGRRNRRMHPTRFVTYLDDSSGLPASLATLDIRTGDVRRYSVPLFESAPGIHRLEVARANETHVAWVVSCAHFASCGWDFRLGPRCYVAPIDDPGSAIELRREENVGHRCPMTTSGGFGFASDGSVITLGAGYVELFDPTTGSSARIPFPAGEMPLYAYRPFVVAGDEVYIFTQVDLQSVSIWRLAGPASTQLELVRRLANHSDYLEGPFLKNGSLIFGTTERGNLHKVDGSHGGWWDGSHRGWWYRLDVDSGELKWILRAQPRVEPAVVRSVLLSHHGEFILEGIPNGKASRNVANHPRRDWHLKLRRFEDGQTVDLGNVCSLGDVGCEWGSPRLPRFPRPIGTVGDRLILGSVGNRLLGFDSTLLSVPLAN